MPRFMVQMTDPDAPAREATWRGIASNRTSAEEACYQKWEELYGVGTAPVSVIVSVNELDLIGAREATRRERRRALAQDALQAGQKHAHAKRRDEAALSRQFIVEELMPQAAAAGLRLDALAELLQVSRQTLCRWREEKERLSLNARSE